MRNAGTRTVPNVAVTVDSFYYTENYPELASNKRPIWIVERGPGQRSRSRPVPERGSQPAGRRADRLRQHLGARRARAAATSNVFEWTVVPVKAGTHASRLQRQRRPRRAREGDAAERRPAASSSTVEIAPRRRRGTSTRTPARSSPATSRPTLEVGARSRRACGSARGRPEPHRCAAATLAFGPLSKGAGLVFATRGACALSPGTTIAFGSRRRPVARRFQEDSIPLMPRTRQHNVTAAQWSANGTALGPLDLTLPGNQVFGANVFSLAEQRQRLPKHVFKPLQRDARARRDARHLARRRGRAGDEGLGDGEGRHALHALVPAADRLDGREARLLLRPGRRRHGDRRVLRQGADPGRARRLVVPDRRHPRDVRGARLHRVGPDLAGVHPREPERRAAVHPDGVRLVDRRGARPQDPAAALDGRAVGRGRAGARAARRRRAPSACSRRSAPSRSTS